MVLVACCVAIVALVVTLILQLAKFFAKGTGFEAKLQELQRKRELCVVEHENAEARIGLLEKKVAELQMEIPLLNKELGVAEAQLKEAEQRLRHRIPTRHKVGNE
ncbi:MAG: hypothetical protein IT369_24515 [Candidatus Latescibacteria bacterium]|nr:hypothetical protein [Candidatus Latescibacterota bacterium]